MEPAENFDLRQDIYLDGTIEMTIHYCISNKMIFMNGLN
jgi:hypothetical protein